MLFDSPIISRGSGSLAGITLSRNRGGNYMRARSMPTNPNTALQQAVRAALAQLSVLWQDTLTPAQRLGWAAYGDNVPVTNRLGASINLTGQNWYIGCNTPRLQALVPRVDDAPVIFNRGEFTAPTFAIDTVSDEVDVSFADTDEWANEDDAHMLVYASIPNDPTINFFKGPYQYRNTIAGDAITAPTSPAAIALPAPIAAGQRDFFRVIVSRADGRLSPDFLGSADAA
jgi:hypothetical protein